MSGLERYVMILLLRGKICLYIQIIAVISINLFGGASLLTVTAISVDRLLALKMMLRYKLNYLRKGDLKSKN